MKIFTISHKDGEKEWVSGRTNIEALHHLVVNTDLDLSDLTDSTIDELPASDWDSHFITGEDGAPLLSFKQYMTENKGPDMIASTVY